MKEGAKNCCDTEDMAKIEKQSEKTDVQELEAKLGDGCFALECGQGWG